MITTVSSDIFVTCGPFLASTPHGCKCDFKPKLCDSNNNKLENMVIIVQL